MKVYKGRIKECKGWSYLCQVQKLNGRYTKPGRYENIFKIGPNLYVISPYYTEKDEWMQGTAEEVLRFMAVK